MQIAQIVPKARTQKTDIFDYSIPEELLPQIKLGILVEIPFSGRKIEGIIIGLKRRSRAKKLKSILKIIDSTPVVDETHIKLAQWMSSNYLVPLGKTLFENIVPPAKRILKTNTHNDTYKKSIVVKNQKKGKKFLIQGEFQERIKIYLKIISKILNQKKQIIILVPDLSLIHFFTKYLKNSISIIHGGLTRTQRFIEWDQIRSGKKQIVIGSNSALFSPTKNLGLIIIDQEENDTYKNDRSPRFHAVKVAEKLSQLTNSNLIIGSVAPKIDSFYKSLRNYYILYKPEKKPQKNQEISIVDMNNQKQAVSLPLQEQIEKFLSINKKIILVLNRKGEGTKFACPDCKWQFNCPKCGLPLIPQEDKTFCFRCQNILIPPSNCPKCQGVNLRPFGLGIKRLQKFVKDLFPQTKIILLEESNSKLLPDIKKLSWDIAIVTSYALKFNFPKIGLVGIIDADQGMNFPDFQAGEKNFQTLFKFLKVGERGIIQTHLPENSLISSLAQLDYEKFFLQELTERQKFGFPPFRKLIRLQYKSPKEYQVKKEVQIVYNELIKIVKNNDLKIEILEPVPAFFKKKRQYFYWQIIIKIYPHKDIKKLSYLKNYLRSLPKWIIDVDPINLL